MSTSTKRTKNSPAGTTIRSVALARAAGTAGTLRRPGATALAAGTAALAAGPVFGQVSGEQVVNGTASFQRQGALTTITASNNAIINYNSFNVRAHETVRFVQPDSLSRVLNRINSSLPTQIDGNITSNGKVYIVNPAGIYFAKGAMINVGGLYAAAGTITNQDFVRGVDRFVSAPGGKVVNEGAITAPVIGLVGERVANFGTLRAPEGAVMMVSGDSVLIGEHFGHVYTRVETAAPAGAEAGPSAGAQGSRRGRFGAGDVYSMAVWNKGTIKADRVVLESDRAGVAAQGTIDVSNTAPGGTGGTVELLGKAVAVQGATIDASGDRAGGKVLVGGNYQGLGAERTSERTVVTAGSEIRADATGRGDGGTVIVWSNGSTFFDGTISARGGAAGGDGGFAEISSKGTLNSNVRVDLSAPRGESGSLLFDPAFIRIDGGSGDGSDDTNANPNSLIHDAGSNSLGTIDFTDFGPPDSVTGAGSSVGNPFIIRESEIEGTNADIILRATQAVSVSGNFNNDADGGGSNDPGTGTVLLNNNRSLTIDVSSTDGAGSIDLTGSTQTTSLIFRTLGSGSITIVGNTAATLNSCDIVVPSLVTAGGDITVGTGLGAVTLQNAINAGAGTVRLFGSGNVSQAAGAVITASSLGAASGGDITLDQANNAASVFAAALTAGTGTVAYRDTDDFSVGTVAAVNGATLTGINAPGGTVKLRSNSSFINQTAPIVTGTLGVGTSTTIGLSNTSNDVDTVALNLAGASGSIAFADSDGFAIGSVTGVGGSTVTGINAGGQNVALTAGSGGTVTQTDPIIGDQLSLSGAGTFSLTNAGNDVTRLQAGLDVGSAVGNVDYVDASSVTILEAANVTGDLSVAAATGTLKAAGTTPGKAIAVGGDLTMTADAVDFSDALLTFSPGGSSVVTVQPFQNSTAVHVADGNATGLSLAQADLNKLSPFSGLVIGSATSQALLTFGGTAGFAQHVTLRSGGTGGSITLLDGSALATSSNKNITIEAGTGNGGVFTMENVSTPASLNAGGGAVSITADAIVLGAADSVQSTGTLLLQPVSPAREIHVGAAVDDPNAFSIDSTEVLALQNGFSKIVIGRDNSNATSSISGAINDALVFQTPAGGTMTVNALVADEGVALVTGGTLNVSQAFSAFNAEITLKSGSNLTIANNIDAGTGTVRLVSDGSITESNGVSITAGALGVRAGGTVDLNQSGNNVGTFAADNSLAGAEVGYTDTNAVTIGQVAAETLNNGVTYFTAVNGVTTNAADFTLAAGGNVGIAGNINVGSSHTVRIASTGAVSQSSGRIIASGLGVTSGGEIFINQTAGAGNQVATIALDASAAASPSRVVYNNGDTVFGVTVGQVSSGGAFGGAIGLISGAGGNILVHTHGGISITQPINAGAGGVRLFSDIGAVAQGASGLITGNFLGVRATAAAGSLAINLQQANIAPNGTMLFAANAGTGDILLNLGSTTNLAIDLIGTDANGFFTSTPGITTSGAARLVSPGQVTQAQPITAATLGIRAASAVTLRNASNAVGTIAIDVSGAAQHAEYRDSNALIVGSVAGLGVFTATDGIVTAGDVSVQTGGLLQLNESIDVGGSNDIRLTSGAGISQTATVGKGLIADALGINAAGDAILLNPDNDVATIAASTTSGVLKYFDDSALAVGSLIADSNGFALTNGFSTAGGDGLLVAFDALTIGDDMTVVGGTLRLVSIGAGVSQASGATITAGTLGVISSGAIDLTQSGNVVGAFAANVTGVNEPVSLTTTGPLTVTNVDFDPDDGGNFPSTAGITTANGAVTLTSTGLQNINQPIDSGTGGMFLNAGGLVTLSSGLRADAAVGVVRIRTTGGVTQTNGDIIASRLGVIAGGDVTLNRVDGSSNPVNNVTVLAATTGSSGGRIAYRDVDALSIGRVDAITNFALTDGITTTGGAYLQSGGALTQTQGIVAGTLGVRAVGPITLNAVDGSSVPVNNVTNFAAASTGAGSTVVYRDSNGLNVTDVAGVSGFAGVTGVSTANDGDALIHSGAVLTIADAINVGGGTVRLVSGNGTTGGGTITAGSLGVRAAGDINLTSLTSDVDTFAAATGSGSVAFHDVDGLTIGTVSALLTFTPAVSGVSGTGTIALQSGAGGTGDLTFDTGQTVAGDTIVLQAGNGFGAPATAIVDALTNGPQFRGPGGTGSPTSFTFRQDASVADSSLPLAAQFGAGTPTAYAIISDDGGVAINDATKVNGTDLTISGTSVSVPPDLQVRSLTISGPATISSVDATGTVNFNNDITFGSSVTIEADEINFGGTVNASVPGLTITLRQKALNRTINLGSTGSDPLDPIAGQLDLTALEISRIQSSFASILIGRSDATGLLQVLNPVTFNAPVTLDMRGVGAAINVGARLAGATGVPITILGNKATTTIGADIVTQGQPIFIDDSVIIAGTPTLDTTGSGAVPAGAAVTITGTTDADAASRSLTVSAGTGGAVAFQDLVGTGAHAGTQALGSLSVTGGTISLPVVRTTGLQAYTGATTLNGNLTSTTGGSITFTGTTTLGAATLRLLTAGGLGDNVVFSGDVDGASNLTIDVGPSGQAQFDSPVGATTALTSLSIEGNTLQVASPVSFRTAGGAISFLGDINGPGETFAVLTGSGPVTLGGNVGTTGAMASFTINAPTVLGANVTVNTSGATAFNGTIEGAGRALTVNAGALTLGGNVGAASAIGAFIANAPVTLAVTPISIATLNAPLQFNGTVSGSSALSVNAGTGAVTFGAAVGSAGSPLLSLAAAGSTIALQGVNTSGAQTYTGVTTLNGDLAAAGPAPITFTGDTTLAGAARSVTTQGGTINFQQRLDGASNLTVNAGAAGVLFTGAVGSQTPLLSLTATGAPVTTGPSVTTAGAQTYNGSARFGGNITTSGAPVTVNGALDFSNAAVTVLTNSAPIALNGTVEGDTDLVLNAGTSTIAVTGDGGGNSRPLRSLTATGSTISVAGMRSAGNQVYNGPTTATGVVSAANLRVNAPSAFISMGDRVQTSGDQVYIGTTTLSNGAEGARLFFYGDTVLGNASAETTYTGAQGVRFVGGLWLFGDSVVNAGNGQAYFHSTVETAQNIAGNNPTPTGAAVPSGTNRSLKVISSRNPQLVTNGADPHTNDPALFNAFVDAPFLFNGAVGGGAFTSPANAPTAAQAARMLKSITFDRGSGAAVSNVATIVQTKSMFNYPLASGGQSSSGTPSSNINDWFAASNPSLRLGSFTIPDGFNFNPGLDSATTRMNTISGFDMGAANKFLSVGNMWIYTDAGNISLGDLASLANINVLIGQIERQFPGDGDLPAGPLPFSIFINQRSSGSVASNQFSNDTGSVVNVTTEDAGVDFVSLNNINFSVPPQLQGTGTARFSTPTVPGRVTFSVDDVDYFGAATQVGNLERSEFLNANVDQNLLVPADGNQGAGGTPFTNLAIYGLGLDLQAEGAPNNDNVATALAGALPTANTSEVQITVSLGSNAIEDLYQLGLEVKGTNSPEYIAERAQSVNGRTDYNDIPPYAKPTTDPGRQDYRVSINRLSSESVRTVLAAYYDLVGEDNAARSERKLQISATLGASWDAYAGPIEEAGGTPDGVGFRRFVEANESEKQSLEYLNKIAVLLREIDKLALSPAEMQAPKQKTLSELRGELMTTKQLEEAALGEPVSTPGASVASAARVAAGGAAR